MGMGDLIPKIAVIRIAIIQKFNCVRDLAVTRSPIVAIVIKSFAN